MTVNEFIKRLQKFSEEERELPIYVSTIDKHHDDPFLIREVDKEEKMIAIHIHFASEEQGFINFSKMHGIEY
jgi:hypothetical protein